MNEMKYSGIDWLGEIPVHWNVVRTKNYFYHTKQVAGENADDYERLALTLNGVIKRPKDDATGLQPEAFDGYQILREGELVFKLIDLANVSTSRVGYSPYTGIVSPAYIVLHPKKEDESLFAQYYFLSMWHREIFNHMGDDGVRSSLNAGDLLNIPYLEIPDEEKQKIVKYLDHVCTEIDSIILKTNATIEEYKKIKRAIIYRAITKGLSENTELVDTGVPWIGEIPRHWELIRTKNRFSHHKDVAGENADDYERLALTLNGVIKRPKDDATGLQPEAFDGYQILREGELVFKLIDLANVSTSRVGYSPYTGIVSPAYIILKPNGDIVTEYAYYYFLSMWQREVFNHMGDDGVRSSLNSKDLLNMPLTLPPMDEQQAIVDFLHEKCKAIDALISKKTELLEQMKNYKKSLVYEYITGKKEVPTA